MGTELEEAIDNLHKAGERGFSAVSRIADYAAEAYESGEINLRSVRILKAFEDGLISVNHFAVLMWRENRPLYFGPSRLKYEFLYFVERVKLSLYRKWIAARNWRRDSKP